VVRINVSGIFDENLNGSIWCRAKIPKGKPPKGKTPRLKTPTTLENSSALETPFDISEKFVFH